MMPLLPPGWPRPKGYSNGYCASGRLVVTAGVVGWDAQENFTSDTLPGQFAQALRNILAIIAEGGAGPAHLVRMTCYVTSIDAYTAGLTEIGAASITRPLPPSHERSFGESQPGRAAKRCP